LSKRIAILGCGWLGLPLAKKLIADGFQINGSTTRDEKLEVLSKERINAFLISLSEDGIMGNTFDFLKDTSIIVINVPPKLRGANRENYIKKIELLHDVISQSTVQKVIFVSSTSVYGAIEGEVTEETEPQPSTESGQQLLKSESIFKNDNNLETTILRFGGLIGPDRHPIHMLSGRKNLSNGHHPINLIHLNDCIRIIQSIMEKNWWNETFNAVYPYHPKKKDYYTLAAKKRGLQVPDYKEDKSIKGKIINSNRLISVKNHVFTTTL